MPINRAAWLEHVNCKPFVVKEAPYTAAQEGQIVIKNQAIGINPVESKVQRAGHIFTLIQYPTIIGFDVAGIVEEVGPGVTSVKKGDRVTAYVIMFPGIPEFN